MISKSFDEITKSDIDYLVTSERPEGREIEYKKELPGQSDEDKREFLKDSSSFANATGGDLIFGIDARGGVPTEACGVGSANADAEILRLESIVRDGLDPRLLGLRTKSIQGFKNGPVVVMRIPKSWASPHLVAFKNSSRFFTRNSAGVHQMDVTEIRSAFLLSEGVADRLRKFRDSRLGSITAGDVPVPMNTESALICHLLPLSDTSIPFAFGQVLQSLAFNALQPLSNTGSASRYNIDGFLVHSEVLDDPKRKCGAYCQLFRTGAVEVVDSWIRINTNRIAPVVWERKIVSALARYLPFLEQLNVPFPVIFACSLLGVKGCEWATGNDFYVFEKRAVDREQINLPDVLIERSNTDIPALLRPVFDALWQAGGHPASLNYDEQTGAWKG